MEDLDQSPLVSSSSGAAAGPARPQPEFKYQFVREPEDEEEEEEEEEDEDEDEDLEELEVLERKPAAGVTAAPLPASAAAADAPLLDFEKESVPPAPRGPLPAAPPAAAERQPRWEPSPVSSTSPSPPPSAAAAASLEEDEPPSRPPPPPPTASLGPHPDPAPPAWTPSTPAPAAPPSTPAAPKRRGSSGSADETLFALPASSEPVMHSSAEKVMNLKEQPGNTKSAGQEDLTSVLLETAASLPSLSPLSAAPFKEHESFGNFSAVSSTDERHQTITEVSKEYTEKEKNPFVDRDLRGFSELKYSEMGSSFEGVQKAELSFKEIAPEEILMKKQDKQENLVSETLRQCQQELPLALIKSEEKDKVTFSEKTKYGKDSISEREITVPFKEDAPLREEYVDFKPFEQVWKTKDSYSEEGNIEDVRGNLDSKLESIVDEKYVADSLRKKNRDKDSESSNEDTSFPSTPEAIKDVSQAYASFEPDAVTETPTKKVFPLLEDQTSENKTDEKKIAEKQAQIVTENNSTIKTTNPFIVSAQDRDRDYVSTDSLSKVPVEGGASMPEGLTPDLVQEAYESKISDAISTKLAYETKMDLVKTSESLQESIHSAAQLCPSFEESEATPSPILPDIVMEAPLNSVTPGAGASAVQLSSSPLEAFTPVNYESLKLESENPPPYEDAMNVPSKEVPEIKEEKKGPECVSPIIEETEASYISIACDLIKETKLCTESASPDFTDYSEIAVKENVSQPMPDLSDLVEDSSPESEPVDLFSDDSIPEVPQKEDEAVLLERENIIETSLSSVIEHESKEKLNALPATMGKPYLESFQPILDTSKAGTDLSSEVTFTVVHKQKIPLQMEELNTAVYSDEDLFVSKEPKIREAELFADSSPIQIVEDFSVTVSSKTVPPTKLAREFTNIEVSLKGEHGSPQEVMSSELPHDLSLKNVPTKVEENVHVLPKAPDVSQDMPEGSKELSLPTDASALPSNAEIVSIVKPKVTLKEAEDKKPSVTENEKRSPSAIFSAELSKTSVVDLLYWRDIKKTGVVFGASLFLLLSLTVFSIVSVTAYIALALLSVTISFRVYKGVIQAIQKSDEGHPFRAYLDSEVAVSEALVQKYSSSALGHVNCTIKELRRLFLVDDLVDSLKFAVLMWIFTYVGALFNGLTLLILALISLFSVPVIYERHQTQIDHYLGLVNKNVKDAMAKIQAKIPGLKSKAE
ncbi:LOW QUALITY PROTEIN: reticulon-4 [Phascolarctos cinereus]|uniref:Reticulon n=1 Tax=Phascolarctos cinereus TaxID=38626 RepID=A0A6P5L2B7_PHACI|nr:LOW QUALITY PROTEIN: reticulon-4 [Phascolarctos cinereus]